MSQCIRTLPGLKQFKNLRLTLAVVLFQVLRVSEQ